MSGAEGSTANKVTGDNEELNDRGETQGTHRRGENGGRNGGRIGLKKMMGTKIRQ